MPVAYLEKLNSEQRRAVEHGVRENACAPVVPLLVIAGAGSGKTNTLAHRVAGAPGFEPGNGGIKIRCLTTCLRAKARAIGSLFLLAAKLSERRRFEEVPAPLKESSTQFDLRPSVTFVQAATASQPESLEVEKMSPPGPHRR